MQQTFQTIPGAFNIKLPFPIYVASVKHDLFFEPSSMTHELKCAGFEVKESSFANPTLKNQTKEAVKNKAEYLVFLDTKNLLNKTVTVRNMATKTITTIGRDLLMAFLKDERLALKASIEERLKKAFEMSALLNNM